MKCKNCFNDTEFIEKFQHEDIETNEDVVHDVWKCPVCEAIHYKEDGYNVYEFTPTILKTTDMIKGFATDYDVALSKKVKKEVESV